MENNNVIHLIHPYKTQHNIWRFDDEGLGIRAEPFVGDINTMIDVMTKHIAGADKGFNAYFADQPFPGAIYHMKKTRDLGSSADYQFNLGNVVGWLCPCLLKFFKTPPDNIFIRVEAARSGLEAARV